MDLRLTDRRVLVTGASRGIGLAIVQAFQAEGADVVATSRNSTPELDDTGVQFFAADLATPDGPRELLEAVLSADSRLDVLVNNAGGGSGTPDALTDPFGGTDAQWAQMLDLNLLAAVRTTRAALPALLTAGGAVVNVSSDSARRPGGALSYSTAKAALSAFSRGLAEAVGPRGVRVNVVSPSATLTPLIAGEDGIARLIATASGVDHDAVLANFPQQTGMLTGRFIDPAEIARAVVLLASPTMPSAVGQNWGVDAGAVKVA
ncbi:SDR family NAD(P)-dependent oxidoreductase [Kineococcus sp. SYSU DK003]|uniref:SDR family NAD(P)-dependent oxidoreductase n=1 Tax=Kineococcus sp. SYSU DK003 TaxID=3383124 RepID=UPI003D7E1855